MWILRLPLYLILSNEGWGWCPVNTVYVVCVHSLNNSVPSVPIVRVCGVLAETKSVGLVPSQAENSKEKFNPVTAWEVLEKPLLPK